MHTPLNNYLRSHRKRAGLSEAEVAHLIGSDHKITVSRHETGQRGVDLDTALLYSKLYKKPVEELFEGRAAEVEAKLRKRARDLSSSLKHVGGRGRVVKLLDQLEAANSTEV